MIEPLGGALLGGDNILEPSLTDTRGIPLTVALRSLRSLRSLGSLLASPPEGEENCREKGPCSNWPVGSIMAVVIGEMGTGCPLGA